MRKISSMRIPRHENQRQAVLKISGLLAAQNQFTNAETRLDTFLGQFPHSPAAATALFCLGDLHLKHYVAEGAAANLQLAQTNLDQFLGVYTNSDYLGHAYLDRGWCGWFASNYVASAADFQQAVDLLPRSLDLAVAHFKLGDALFKENEFTNAPENFTNALENYRVVLDDFADFPEVAQKLDRAGALPEFAGERGDG